MEISTPAEVAVETHFPVGYGNETIPVILPANGKAFYLLLQSLVHLISDGRVESGNKCFFQSLQRGNCKPH